jgi:hypothetical protein
MVFRDVVRLERRAVRGRDDDACRSRRNISAVNGETAQKPAVFEAFEARLTMDQAAHRLCSAAVHGRTPSCDNQR